MRIELALPSTNPALLPLYCRVVELGRLDGRNHRGRQNGHPPVWARTTPVRKVDVVTQFTGKTTPFRYESMQISRVKQGPEMKNNQNNNNNNNLARISCLPSRQGKSRRKGASSTEDLPVCFIRPRRQSEGDPLEGKEANRL